MNGELANGYTRLGSAEKVKFRRKFIVRMSGRGKESYFPWQRKKEREGERTVESRKKAFPKF